MADGRIAGFTTAMTGELFALLRGHSLLAGALTAEVTDGDAFREGLAEGARRDLAASLFGIRAASVLGRSEEHTSELQSLMRISYAVFCLKKKNKQYTTSYNHHFFVHHVPTVHLK